MSHSVAVDFPEPQPFPTQQPPGQPVNGAPPTPERPSYAVLLLGALALALVVAVGLGTYFALKPSGSSTPSSAVAAPSASSTSYPPPMRTARGYLVLVQGQFIWESEADPSCHGFKSFDDLVAGATVVVTDATGKKVALGTLKEGTATGITKDPSLGLARASECDMPFEVSNIPGRAGPYGIEIADRGAITVTEKELGSVHLSLR